ncbi:MAG: DUF4038 domain-containing protein [Phycisphaerae bacterium]|nr:DUF4038 domain-containing protein [Phycisphaerae bacterium]
MAAGNVPRFSVQEVAIERPVSGNPFAEDVALVVRRPDGEERRVPAFYDGGDVWRVRLAPDVVGRWTARIEPADGIRRVSGLLEAPSGALECVAGVDAKARGGVEIVPDRPYHFRRQDGSPYFLMGYECDWLFALDMNFPDRRPMAGFLDTLARYGFNYLVVQAYAHDTDWRPGRSEPHDVGPPALFAWEGTNEKPDHTRLNLDYWRAYDRMVEGLHARSMTTQIMVKVYNKRVNWPDKGSPEDDLFWRYVVARYQAYDVVWNLTKEAWRDKDLAYWNDRAALVRRWDAHRRLVCIHDWNVPEMDADFLTEQQHTHWHEHILAERTRGRRPVVNIEYGYEQGSTTTYGVVQDADEVLRRTWLIVVAGGYPVYYFNPTAWDVIRWDEIPPGYARMHVVREVMESLPFADMEPHDELAEGAGCLAKPGEVYLLYAEKRGPVTLALEGGGRFAVEWVDPRDGAWHAAGTVAGGHATLAPPTGLASADAVLIVRRTP